MFLNRALVVCAALAAMLAPSALADEWDHETHFTFNQAVEVPGRVLLPGTYTFRLLDSPSNRNIVGIYNRDMTQLYTIVLATSDYRLTPTSRPELTFEERSAKSPRAINTWWYPGDNFGHHFVYYGGAPTVNIAPAPANMSGTNMHTPSVGAPESNVGLAGAGTVALR